MPTVDLIYDPACPNLAAARANLMRGFSKAGVPARWREHDTSSAETPAEARAFGSPTILVDGRDVDGVQRASGSSCRVYAEGLGLSGAPSIEAIASALLAAQRAASAYPTVLSSPATPARTRWRHIASFLPTAGVALLPKVACPLCWPAYAAVLSACGLTFLMEDRWLLPISAAFLMVTLTVLARGARRRRGFGPVVTGLVAAGLLLGGKFVLESDAVLYGGAMGLVAACVWNAWPRRSPSRGCSACPVDTKS